VIIATPNQIHVANGLEAVAAGVPALVEKPIADDIASATAMVEAAEAAGVALLVGHHRRHNPMIQAARRAIDAGRLGDVLAVHGICWVFKPDDYFDIPWRREKGAGPVYLNLIHDVDNLRYLCGEVASVQALESNAVRGNAVEETAVILLRFASGALGTVTVSDSIVAPWSWELTTGENPNYPRTSEGCYQIGGTHGALSIPQLDLWRNAGTRSWFEPIAPERLPYKPQDPLRLQVQQFCKVIRGEEAPLVSGREGLETLRVIDAVKRSAAAGEMIRLRG
jgi:predicted dehydrogenase